MPNRFVRAWVVAPLIALLALPRVAFAHAHLTRSEPARGARLSTAPTALRLWFSEAPQLAVTRIYLIGPARDTIPVGSPQSLPGDGLSVAVTAPLPGGTYTIVYHTAAADGHPVRGSYTFTMLPQATAVVPPAAATTDIMRASADSARRTPQGTAGRSNALVEVTPVDERSDASSARFAATRWAELVALLAVLGALGFRFGVARRLHAAADERLSRDTLDGVRRVALGALLLLFLAALSRLTAESVALEGAANAYTSSAIRALLLGTVWGHGWLVELAGVIVAAIGLALAGRAVGGAWVIAAIGGLLLCVAPALTGHAVAGRLPALGVTADAVHVASAGAWMGSLLMLALVALPHAARGDAGVSRAERARTVVAAFSPMALTAATLLVLSGLVSAWLRLGALSALWGSHYGRVLIWKLVAVAVVLAIGAFNWKVRTPALVDDASVGRIRRSAIAELAMAVVVIAVTAVLVATPLPQDGAPTTTPTTAVAP